jgi:hypothetical protein
MDPNGTAAPGGDGSAPTEYRPPRLAFVHRLTFRLAAVVLIGVVPLAIVLAWAGISGRDAAVRAGAEEVSRLARVAARVQEQEFDESFRVLEALAPALISAPDADRARLLAETLPRCPKVADLHLVRADGTVVAASLAPEASRAHVDADTVARAAKTGYAAVGGFRPGDPPTARVALPMPAGTAGGPLVLGASIRLESLAGFQRTLQLPEGALLDILDPESKVALRLGPSGDAVGRAHPLPAIQAAVVEDPGAPLAGADVDGVRRVFGVEGMGLGEKRLGHLVVVATPESVILEPARQRLAVYLAGSGIVFVIALALSRVFGERFVLRPVQGVVQATRRVASTDLRHFKARRRVCQDPSELGDLERAFDEMATALERRAAELEEQGRGR